MRVRLTIDESTLTAALRRCREAGAPFVEFPAGTRHDADGIELLCPMAAAADRSEPDRAVTVRILELPRGLRGISHHYWSGHVIDLARPRLDMAMHPDGRGGSAAWLTPEGIGPVAEVRVVGAGLPIWRPGCPPPVDEPAPRDGPWSRRIDAIGGTAVFRRWRALRFALVGVGGLGSQIAPLFAAAGAASAVLVDADPVESHNVERMLVFADACGQRKVVAHAELLRRTAPWTEVEIVTAPVESPAAIRALASADVIVTAPDRDDARLQAAIVATAFLRPHLDLGTGVFETPTGIEAGADLRLVLPGRCLLCVGGLDLERRADVPWWRERAGSLRSVNTLAAAAGFRMVEALVTGALAETTWQRLRCGPEGGVEGVRMPVPTGDDCPLCGQYRGVGRRILERGPRFG